MTLSDFNLTNHDKSFFVFSFFVVSLALSMAVMQYFMGNQSPAKKLQKYECSFSFFFNKLLVNEDTFLYTMHGSHRNIFQQGTPTYVFASRYPYVLIQAQSYPFHQLSDVCWLEFSPFGDDAEPLKTGTLCHCIENRLNQSHIRLLNSGGKKGL